jgi:hypothetical protein
MDCVRNLLGTINNLLFPYRYLQSPAFEVSRNLMAWDRMLMNLS